MKSLKYKCKSCKASVYPRGENWVCSECGSREYETIEIPYVTCIACGWVYYVDPDAPENAVWRCKCGVVGKENFREAREGDCPVGVTIGPVN